MNISYVISYINKNAAVLLLIAVYIFVRSLYWDCPPIWDGTIYYVGLLNAVTTPFNILNFNVDNHICQSFFLVMGFPYEFYSSNYYLFNIWLSLFGVISVVTFYKLLEFFTGDYLHPFEIALITALFAFHPSVLASMINFNLDIGMLTFFLLYWLFLLRDKKVIATVFATLLIFSKEPAILLLPLPFLFSLFIKPFPERIKWLRNNIIVLIVPYFILGLFLFFKVIVYRAPAVWAYKTVAQPPTILNYFSHDGKLLTYLGMIFILNFNWVLTLLWGILFILLIIKGNYRNEIRQKNIALLIFLLFGAGVFVLTLVRTFSNVRYVITLFPIMILGITYLFRQLNVSRFIRISIILLLLGIFSWENARTIDPVSKAFFGTFNFGKHQILHIKSRTDEWGGLGRDQLVYNLEYLNFQRLMSVVTEDLRPTHETSIICVRDAGLITLAVLDTNYKRTFMVKNIFFPTVDDIVKQKHLPADAYFLEYPNYDNHRDIKILNTLYPNKTDKLYDLNGYEMSVIHYEN